MAKLTKKELTAKVMRKAWQIRKVATTAVLTMSDALKEAWKVVKALAKGVVTFWKMDGSVTTRRIAAISGFDYTPKGTGSPTDTIKVVDLDKLDLTGDVEKSIISFNRFQIL